MELEGDRDRAPRIRSARPITAMPFEGTRKRRRAAMGEYNWSVGDRVDAWMQDRYVCIIFCFSALDSNGIVEVMGAVKNLYES